jgi:hypothetical protein
VGYVEDEVDDLRGVIKREAYKAIMLINLVSLLLNLLLIFLIIIVRSSCEFDSVSVAAAQA